jgi:Xaa-Pro aminopeptidase
MEKLEVLSQRIENVRAAMKEYEVDALIIPRTERMATVDVRYISGFTGSTGFIVVTRDKAFLYVDSRYTHQAKKETYGVDVVEWSSMTQLLNETIAHDLGNAARVGFMKSDVTVSFLDMAEELVPSVKFIRLPPFLTNIRAVKSEEEIEKITRSLRATEAALEHAFKFVKQGVSELEVADAFENALPRGAKPAFESIVASGERSIEAHGIASDKIIKEGEVVQFDVGCSVDGYASDISRIVVCGRATPEQRKMHRAVLKAIHEALHFYRPGIDTVEAHNRSQEVFDSLGYAKDKFRHGLGHGVGLDVHEAPVVASATTSALVTVFENKQVVTVEPGVYSEKLKFGMRVECDVLITEDGHEVLDRLSTRLVETGKL